MYCFVTKCIKFQMILLLIGLKKVSATYACVSVDWNNRYGSQYISIVQRAKSFCIDWTLKYTGQWLPYNKDKRSLFDDYKQREYWELLSLLKIQIDHIIWIVTAIKNHRCASEEFESYSRYKWQENHGN